MKIAIITAAGISSRFNEGVREEDRQLKAIYHEGERRDTLLMHLMMQCSFADKIIVVGGYRYGGLQTYVDREVPEALRQKAALVYNPHYRDLASGYSLYLGLEEAFREDGAAEILFVEGDLCIDADSFKRAAESKSTVLTYNHEPIYAEKAVVLYRSRTGKYNYAFNASHGVLAIDEPFSCIFHSGQLWKFTDMDALKEASRIFYDTERDGTNLKIIQEYINRIPEKDIKLMGLKKWVNCNTKEDFRRIAVIWEDEA